MSTTKRLSESERRKEIMDSASKVISEKGFFNTTMEDIIAGTTLSKGGVYHYYGSTVEIFRDIMISGIEYRNKIITEHLSECKKGCVNEFMAKQMVDKILDDNPYMPLYVEFLIAKKRNSALNNLMKDLQEQTRESFKTLINELPEWVIDENIFQFVTDFMNSMIMASNVLDARECLSKNRKILENIIVLIFNNSKGGNYESL